MKRLLLSLLLGLGLANLPAQAQEVYHSFPNGTTPTGSEIIGPIFQNNASVTLSTNTIVGQTPFVSTKGNTARANTDRASDVLNVKDFGAKCDGITNDGPAFLATITAADAAGKTTVFSGSCYISTAVTITTPPPSGLISIHGQGGKIITNGNDLFQYKPPANTTGLAQFSIMNINVTNAGTTTNSGDFFNVDCTGQATTTTTFCTYGASEFSGLTLTDMANGLDMTEATDIQFHSSTIVHHNTNTQAAAVSATGPMIGSAQGYSSGLFMGDVYIVGGTGLLTNGGIQGFQVRNVNLLLGSWGVIFTNPVGIEGITIIDNYLEAYNGGVIIPSGAFIQVHGNTFDAPPAGVSTGYDAIKLGDATKNVIFGGQVSGNMAFGFNGAVIDTVMYADMENGSTFSDNSAVGTFNTNNCMVVGTLAQPAYSGTITMTGNSCWQSGVMSTFGTGVQAKGNSYTQGSLTNIPFTMDAGSQYPTDTNAGRTLNGLSEIGAPGVTFNNGLVGSAGILDFHDAATTDGTVNTLNDYDSRLLSVHGVAGAKGSGGLELVGASGLELYDGAINVDNGLINVGGRQAGAIFFKGINLGNTSDAQILQIGGTAGVLNSGYLSVIDAYTIFNSAILTPKVRYLGFAVPATPNAACDAGDSGDGVLGGVYYHFYCIATNSWQRVALTPPTSAASW